MMHYFRMIFFAKLRQNLELIKLIAVMLVLACSYPTQAFEWVDINFGLGLYSYDNIRPNNKRIFLKNDPVVEPLLTFQIRVGPIIINKDGGGVALLYFKNVKLMGLAVYEGKRYKTDGMEERKPSFFVGGGARFYFLEGIYYQDVQSRSYGKMLRISLAPEFEIGKNFTLTTRLYTQFYNQKYVDYYFGVRPEEVDPTIGRFAYVGKRATNYGILFQNVWEVDKTKYVIATEYKRYGASVYESPTVIRKDEKRLILGFLYKFY